MLSSLFEIALYRNCITGGIVRLLKPKALLYTLYLSLDLLLDSQLTTVETALWAYSVVKNSRTAVRASNYCWNNSLVVSSTLVASS